MAAIENTLFNYYDVWNSLTDYASLGRRIGAF
jgi:hypothetical protein